MREGEETYGQIDRFLRGELTPDERAQFDSELATNPDLQNKVKAYQLAEQLVFENRLLAVKELMRETHVASQNKGWKKYLLFTGTALLIGSIGYWVSYDPRNESVNQKKTEPLQHKANKILTEEEQETKEVLKPSKAISDKPIVQKRENKMAVEASQNEKEGKTLTAHSPNKLSNELPEMHPAEAEPQTIAKMNQVHTKAMSVCDGVSITANVFVNPSCIKEENGSISISSIKGGKEPYQVEVYQDKQLITLLHGLKQGTYFIVLTDANHCSAQINNVKVPGRECQHKYHFNPFIGETWAVPVHESDGNLTILDKAGNVYFRTEIPAGNQEHWSGQPLHGEVSTGYFLFTLQYRDGSTKQGTISIVR